VVPVVGLLAAVPLAAEQPGAPDLIGWVLIPASAAL
jgi:hypothetical protein